MLATIRFTGVSVLPTKKSLPQNPDSSPLVAMNTTDRRGAFRPARSSRATASMTATPDALSSAPL
jgi:hypothetical protein